MTKDQELVEKMVIAFEQFGDEYDIHQAMAAVADIIKPVIRTATLDDVKELAEHEKVGANENDGEGDRYYDKALTDLIKAIDNLRGESDDIS